MHQEPLPFLPATRPRLLSQESVPSDGEPEPSSSLENYGLLERLPYEVRHQILVEAFGGRRLHVDLSYSHPLVRKPLKVKTFGSGSGVISGYRHCALGSELVRDSSRPEGWQWFGCVCHRRAGFSETETQQRYGAGEYSQSIEPCDDDCLDGQGSMCSCGVGQPGRDGAACFVGVMGWLLACRQAYVQLQPSNGTRGLSSWTGRTIKLMGAQLFGWHRGPLRHKHFPLVQPGSASQPATPRPPLLPGNDNVPRAPVAAESDRSKEGQRTSQEPRRTALGRQFRLAGPSGVSPACHVRHDTTGIPSPS